MPLVKGKAAKTRKGFSANIKQETLSEFSSKSIIQNSRILPPITIFSLKERKNCHYLIDE